MIHKTKEGVLGIVFSKDRTQVLLTKRRDLSIWALPGGGIEPNESIEQAAIREMAEETGYHVKPTRKIAQYLLKGYTIHHYIHFYEFHILSGNPTLSNETQEIKFFPLCALPSKLSPLHSEWIEDALPLCSQTLKKEVPITLVKIIKFLMFHPLLFARFVFIKLKTYPIIKKVRFW